MKRHRLARALGWWWILADLLVVLAGVGCERGGGEGGAALGTAGPAAAGPRAGSGSGSAGTGQDALAATLRQRILPPPAPARDVPDFGPPAPTLFFVASLKGFTEPCGCTVGLQVGGLQRLVGTVEAARRQEPASLVVDGGDLLFETPQIEPRLVEQERRRVPLLVDAHRRLGTVSTTPGPADLALGLDFYRQALAGSGMVILAANLTAADGQPLAQPTLERDLGGLRLGLVGAVDPARFADEHEVVASPAAPAVAQAVAALQASGVRTIVLVMQGDLAATRAVAEAVDGIDFAIVGHDPAETDEVVQVGQTSILQAYDQGRYVGILKLYPAPDGQYRDARQQDRDALGRVDRRLDYLRGQLALLPPSLPGEEPPIVLTMRQQVDELQSQRLELSQGRIDIPEGGGGFVYWPLALEPGYPEDADVAAAMAAYNESLAEVNRTRTDVVPLGPGDVAYVGVDRCATCHQAAYRMWLTTPHALAIETLERRDKAFDERCVGCHVTGFLRPGGSVTANHHGLANVQCEACHGPGADHAAAPPGHIQRDAPAAVCTTCHTTDHSPQFDYDRYLPLILGSGHGQPPTPPAP